MIKISEIEFFGKVFIEVATYFKAIGSDLLLFDATYFMVSFNSIATVCHS